MRATPIANSFAGGEVSNDIAEGRTDIQWQRSTCRLLENMIPIPQGGAIRRGGARYVAELKSSSARSELIRFEYSVFQAYMLETGDRYIRPFKDKAPIVAADIATAITNGDFTTNLTGWTDNDSGSGVSSHDAGNGRMSLKPGGVTGSDIAARTQAVTVAAGDQAKLHVMQFDVIGMPADRILLNVGTTAGGGELINDQEFQTGFHTASFTPGAGTIYVRFKVKGDNNNTFTSLDKIIQIDNVAFLDNQTIEVRSPYLQADLFDSDGRFRIKYTQSLDVLRLSHQSYKPFEVDRLGHSDWSVSPIVFTDGPYLDENTTTTTIAAGATTGAGITFTANAKTGINRSRGFLSTDVGRLIRVKDGSTWGWGIIVEYLTLLTVKVDIYGAIGGTTAVTLWQLGLWSDTDGWPGCATFFEERHWLAGSIAKSNRFDGSSSDDFDDFIPGTGDGDAVAFALASDQANPIRWLAPADRLLIGTAGAEFAVAGSGTYDPVITPTNGKARSSTRNGVADMMPAIIGNNAILYVQRHGKELREIAFDPNAGETGSYVAEDMSVRAQHLMRGGLTGLAWQQKPFGVLWCRRKDGLLPGFTYQRKQEVTAWSRHRLANTVAGTGAIVESCACIPGTGEDQFWLIVRRTINGQTKRYIEIVEQPLRDDQDQIEAFYVDSGLTYDGAQSTTLTPGTGATVKGTTNVPFTAGSGIFVTGDIGREIRYHQSADAEANPVKVAIEGRAVITGRDSATVVRCRILGAFPNLTAIVAGAWRLSVTTISNLGHLEGETVQILTDGSVHPPKTVVSGAVTLNYPATYIHAGLGYSSKLKPVRFDAGAVEGTSVGKKQRISSLTVLLERSLGFSYGPSEAKLDRAKFRDYGDMMDMPPPLFTGAKEVKFRGSYDRSGNVLIVQDQPLPLKVVAIVPTLETAEGG